jgi:hypothetical protein
MAKPTNTTQNEQAVEDAVACELGARVQDDFRIAKTARTNTDYLLIQCLRQRKGEYDPQELASFGSVAVFVNYTSTKCRAGEAWLDDILASTRERPWTLAPTPIPEVPQFVRNMIVQKIKQEIVQFGAPADKVDQYIRDRAVDLKNIVMDLMHTAAQTAVDNMSQKIEDQLDEANFAKAFSEFRSDLITYPYAVLKGPIVRNKKVLRWENGSSTPIVKVENVLVVERVSPFDFYWAPWATTPNEGYTVEVMRMEQKALYDCIDLPNFDSEKIRMALGLYEFGHQEMVQTRAQREVLEQNTHLLQTANTIDVLDYWGSIKGSMLTGWGMHGIDDPDKYYDVNVWVVDNLCIRAVINPSPLGVRPYYVTSYEKIPGSLVGRSTPMLMKPHQDIINSAYRALRRNMGLSSGPFAEVDQSRLSDGQAPEEILPASVKLVEPDLTGSNSPVYRFHKIDSVAPELTSVINMEVKACDDATGIPAYSYGNAAVAGAGRTVGGLAMLMGNASKGIKKVIGHIERDILEPFITEMYNYNMLFDPDESLKVDAQVVARGPTGIIMREAMIQRRLESLQLITPYAASGVVPKEGLAVLLREVLRGLEMPVDKIIPDPEKRAQLQDAANAVTATPAGVGQAAAMIQSSGGKPPKMGSKNRRQLPFIPDQGNGSIPPPQGKGTMATASPKLGQGTVPTPIPDGRSGLARQVVASNPF